MFPRPISQAVGGLAFLISSFHALAGSFAANPVRVTLSAQLPVASMTIRNEGADPAVIQLEALAWSQDGEKDVFSATRDVLATPPIFTISPGGSQVVRVGLRRPADARRELTYRLFLQEVPPPPRPGFKGLQVALRLSVPVFVVPAVSAAPLLHWHAAATAKGLRLGVTNGGSAHIQLSSIAVAPGNGARFAPLRISTYVLPGESREWIVKSARAPAAGEPLSVSAQSDAGELRADVVVDKR